MWIGKEDLYEEILGEAFRSLWKGKSLWKDLRGNKEKMALLLAISAMNMSEKRIDELTENLAYITKDNAELYRFFLCEGSDLVPSSSLKKRLEVFWAVMDYFSLSTSFENLVVAASLAVATPLEGKSSARRAFEAQLVVLSSCVSYGTSLEYTISGLRIFPERSSSIYVWARDLDRALNRTLDRALNRTLDRALNRAEYRAWAHVLDLPNVPKRVNLYNELLWHKVENAFEKEKPGEFEIYTAAWLLIFDAWLYISEYYKTKDESIFAHLADITREIDAPPICIAHCIRDLAYGDESRTGDLKAMVNSDDPQYRKIFETVYWRPKSK